MIDKNIDAESSRIRFFSEKESRSVTPDMLTDLQNEPVMDFIREYEERGEFLQAFDWPSKYPLVGLVCRLAALVGVDQ